MSEGILPQHYPWQQPQWQQLTAMASARRLPHALLFKGPADTGKSRFALAFTHWLLCAQPADEGACGVCSNCQLMLAQTHPDIKSIGLRDGKRQIVIEQVRELIDFCNQTAYREGGRKIVVISPAENMNLQAANALLKTLEEPAGESLLMLVCHAPSLLPATIRSRCFSLSFPLPGREQSLAWLKTFASGDTADTVLLDEAGGRPLAVARLLESDALQTRGMLDALIADLDAGKATPVSAAEQFQQLDSGLVLDWLVLRLQALARCRTLGEPLHAKLTWGGWERIGARDALALLQRVLDIRARLQRGVAINQRLVFESLLLDWQAHAGG